MTELAWGGCTHVGHVRAVNEDSYVVSPPVFLVADGMGGHQFGDIASATVAEEFTQLALAADLDAEAVAETIEHANATIRGIDADAPAGREMGTTAAGIALVGPDPEPSWVLFNVGDSRVYRYAEGSLEQLSVDHSLVQELVDAGDLTEAEARTHPDRHVITRAVGLDEHVVADFVVRTPLPGERFLLCSDGLHDELTEREIASVLALNPEPQRAAEALIDAVLAGTARDNVTAVVVDVVSVAPTAEGDPASERTDPGLLAAVPATTDAVEPPAADFVGLASDEADLHVAEPVAPGDPVDPETMIEVPRW